MLLPGDLLLPLRPRKREVAELCQSIFPAVLLPFRPMRRCADGLRQTDALLLTTARAIIAATGAAVDHNLIRAEKGELHRGFRMVSGEGLAGSAVRSALAAMGIGLPPALADVALFSRLDAFEYGAGFRAVIAVRDCTGDIAFDTEYELESRGCIAISKIVELPAARSQAVAGWIERTGAGVDPARIRFLLDMFPLCGGGRYPAGSLQLILRGLPDGKERTCGLRLDAARLVRDYRANTAAARRLLESDASLAAEGEAMEDLAAAVFDDQTVISWKPAKLEVVHRETNPVEKSIRDGMDALARECRAGHWRDYLLPAGESDAWVTAWVLYHLSGSASDGVSPAVRETMAAGARWLMEHPSRGGGWGYSTGADSDADSTSLAILSLRRMGLDVPSEAVRFWERCQTPEGASTYPAVEGEDSGWTRAAIEIMPLAAGDGCIDFLRARQMENGLWPGYWWVSPLYATWMALENIGTRCDVPRREILERTLSGYEGGGAFENALLLLCLCQPALGGGARGVRERAIAAILGQQMDGGIWPGSALMRLPHRQVTEPWKEIDPGATYRDVRGLFTTAAAIAALRASLNFS